MARHPLAGIQGKSNAETLSHALAGDQDAGRWLVPKSSNNHRYRPKASTPFYSACSREGPIARPQQSVTVAERHVRTNKAAEGCLAATDSGLRPGDSPSALRSPGRLPEACWLPGEPFKEKGLLVRIRVIGRDDPDRKCTCLMPKAGLSKKKDVRKAAKKLLLASLINARENKSTKARPVMAHWPLLVCGPPGSDKCRATPLLRHAWIALS
jgi:hypothetical protein